MYTFIKPLRNMIKFNKSKCVTNSSIIDSGVYFEVKDTDFISPNGEYYLSLQGYSSSHNPDDESYISHLKTVDYFRGLKDSGYTYNSVKGVLIDTSPFRETKGEEIPVIWIGLRNQEEIICWHLYSVKTHKFIAAFVGSTSANLEMSFFGPSLKNDISLKAYSGFCEVKKIPIELEGVKIGETFTGTGIIISYDEEDGPEVVKVYDITNRKIVNLPILDGFYPSVQSDSNGIVLYTSGEYDGDNKDGYFDIKSGYFFNNPLMRYDTNTNGTFIEHNVTDANRLVLRTWTFGEPWIYEIKTRILKSRIISMNPIYNGKYYRIIENIPGGVKKTHYIGLQTGYEYNLESVSTTDMDEYLIFDDGKRYLFENNKIGAFGSFSVSKIKSEDIHEDMFEYFTEGNEVLYEPFRVTEE